MKSQISKETEKLIIKSIMRYFDENFREEINELQATLLFDYFTKEIGPIVYNQAISDAQSVMIEKINDLEGTCYQEEFGYWKK